MAKLPNSEMTTLVFKCSGEVGFGGGLRISRRQGNRQYDLASQQPRYGRSRFPASPLLPLSLMLCQLETETRIEWITIHITTASSRGYAAVLSKGQACLSVCSMGSSGQRCTQGSSNNGITGAFMEPLGRPLFLPSIVIYVGTISVEFAVFCLETRRITAITHAACAFSLFVILKFWFDALDPEEQTKHNRHSHYTTRHAWPCRCLGATLPYHYRLLARLGPREVPSLKTEMD